MGITKEAILFANLFKVGLKNCIIGLYHCNVVLIGEFQELIYDESQEVYYIRIKACAKYESDSDEDGVKLYCLALNAITNAWFADDNETDTYFKKLKVTIVRNNKQAKETFQTIMEKFQAIQQVKELVNTNQIKKEDISKFLDL